MLEHLLEARRINLYLLDAVAPENLGASLLSKGCAAGEQFAHLHNVRSIRIKSALPAAIRNLGMGNSPKYAER